MSIKKQIKMRLFECNEEIIDTVYKKLQSREIHPSGFFDSAGRFVAENSDIVTVRRPSRRWPFSHMIHCRTKKYVRRVCEKFQCETLDELIRHV